MHVQYDRPKLSVTICHESKRSIMPENGGVSAGTRRTIVIFTLYPLFTCEGLDKDLHYLK